MTTQDKGIRALVPGVVLPSEEREIREAKEYIKRKIGAGSNLQAAPTLSNMDINLLSSSLHKPIIEKLPVEKKDEYGFTKLQNKQIYDYLTRPADPNSVGAFDREKKRVEQEERKMKKLKEYGIEESSIKHPDYPKVSNQPILRNNINVKKDVLKGSVTVDPKHPDGFRLTNDEDLYRHYGDTPVRYIQEVMYKYENDAPAPTETIKRFDGMDKSSYPSDPTQKKLLTKYENIYKKLNPAQKRQLVANPPKNKIIL